MSSISFLKNRQIGGKCRSGFRNSTSSLNLDHVFSRLVCHKKDIFTVRGEEADVPPFSCKFRRDAQSDLLAVANEDGDITLYDTSKGYPESKLKSFVAHQNAVFDICWMPDKCQLITGSGDHHASLWDISSCKLVSIFKKHTSSVKSIDICREESTIFATGSRDGCVNVWDVRDQACSVHQKPAVNINFAHCRKNSFAAGKRFAQKDPVSSVSAVAFKDSNHVASAGVADGKIKIWDLRKTYVMSPKYLPSPKVQMNYSDGALGHGCTSLVFDSYYNTLYACVTNNKIMKFNCHSYTKEADVYEGFRAATYFVKLALSSDNQYLLSGSSDDIAYIWKTSRPGLPIMKLSAHRAEVTSVCWSPYDNTKLVTCGDDNKVAIWKIAEAESPVENDDIFAVAECYSASPKNENLPVQVTVQRSTTLCNIPVKKSSTLLNQTPNKPSVRSIKSFFSPVTPSSTSTPIKSPQSAIAKNSSNSPSPSNKLLNKSPNSELSQVLTPCNHLHKNTNSLLNQCSEGNSEILSSPELKNSSLENKSSSPSFLSSSLSVQNKENSSNRISPEIIYKKNSIGQTKRKITSKPSTPNLKRKQTESSKKTKGLSKQDKKTTSEKTIMNYFSVAVSPGS